MYGCGEQEVGVVSRRWVWLVGEGGLYECGCKEVYRFPHTTYPYSSCICSFCSSIPTFCSFKKMFFVLVPYIHALINATCAETRLYR